MQRVPELSDAKRQAASLQICVKPEEIARTQYVWSDAPFCRHTSAHTRFLLRLMRLFRPCTAQSDTRQAIMLRLPRASCATGAGAGRCAGEGLPDIATVPLMWTAFLGLLEKTCTEDDLSINRINYLVHLNTIIAH